MKKVKMKRRGLSAKEQLMEAFSYLKESFFYISFILILFFLSSLLGYFKSGNLVFFNEILKEIVVKTKDLGPIELIFFILQNNLESALLSMFLGFFFGLPSLISAGFNGLLLGYVVNLAYGVGGMSLFEILFRILPHGVFELPAVFISMGVGLKIGGELVKNYFEHYKKKNKFLFWISITLILFNFFSFGIAFFNLFFQEKPVFSKDMASLDFNLVIFLGFSFYFLFMLFILFLVSAIFDGELREKQLANIRHNFYNAVNLALMVIVPLLIIAAVVEGILIAFLS